MSSSTWLINFSSSSIFEYSTQIDISSQVQPLHVILLSFLLYEWDDESSS